MLFHQVNAPQHKSNKTIAELHELRYELLPGPPYNSDLAPSFKINSVLTKRLPLKLRPFLRLKGNRTIEMVSKICTTAIIDVSPSTATILNDQRMCFVMLVYELSRFLRENNMDNVFKKIKFINSIKK